MKYIKPELKIEKFSIIEEITDEGTSGSSFTPIIEGNTDKEGDFGYESIGEALNNIFGN